jgi:hypothetical protein
MSVPVGASRSRLLIAVVAFVGISAVSCGGSTGSAYLNQPAGLPAGGCG